jgi:peptidoglycan/LPS O-acetylase OafA/YrhL
LIVIRAVAGEYGSLLVDTVCRLADDDETSTTLGALTTDVPVRSATPRMHRLVHQPALDGLRGVAVAVVVLFHLDIGVFRGGYLGVSVFFTLSGFLITSVLLDEWHERGDIDLGRFYLRRLKRLMPASLLTLLSIVVLVVTGVLAKSAQVRGDVMAAALNVFNWHELGSGDSYAALFQSRSSVAHFWSLAIEEQFYLAWPLVMLLLLRGLHVGRRVLLGTIAALFVLSALSAIPADNDLTYFGTFTRAAEILAGALLAAWMSTSTRVGWPTWWRHVGLPALGLVLVATLVTPTSSGWAYQGGLAAFSVVSVGLIVGAHTDSVLRRMLAVRPLVALGRVSYGVYLVHWPVFVVLDERRTGVDGLGLAVLRVVVTVLIAAIMFVAIERPIRMSSALRRPRSGVTLAAACSLALVGTAASTIDAPDERPSAPAVLTAPAVAPRAPALALEREPAQAPGADRPAPAIDDKTPTTRETAPPVAAQLEPTPPTPTVIAVFGDSVPAWLLRDAAPSFTRTDVTILNGAGEACDGMVALPIGRDRRGTELVPPPTCADWTLTYQDTLASAPRVDIGLLVLGQAPVIDRLIDGQWQGPCAGIDWYLDDLGQRVEFLRARNVEPVLALPARFGRFITFMVSDDHEQRIECVRAALLRFAIENGLSVVDLDPLLCVDGDCDARRTADGVHIDSPVAPQVLDEVLDEVLALELGDLQTG